MLKRGTVGWLIWTVVIAAILITFGILNIAFNNNAEYQSVIIMIVGILVVVDASIRLLVNVLTIVTLSNDRIYAYTKRSAIVSSLELAVGISIIHLARIVDTSGIVTAEFLFRFIGNFIGITMIVLASIMLIYGIILIIKTKRRLLDIVLILIAAAILIVVGILDLIYIKDENVLRVFFIFFGIIGIISGLMALLGSLLVFRLTRKKANLAKEIVAEKNETQE